MDSMLTWGSTGGMVVMIMVSLRPVHSSPGRLSIPRTRIVVLKGVKNTKKMMKSSRSHRLAREGLRLLPFSTTMPIS